MRNRNETRLTSISKILMIASWANFVLTILYHNRFQEDDKMRAQAGLEPLDTPSSPFTLESPFFCLGVAISAISTVILLAQAASPAQRYYSFWSEQRKHRQLENYEISLKARQVLVDALDLKFNNLSQENKLALWLQGLAEKDDTGTVFIKFYCPISMQLMTVPAALCVDAGGEKKFEYYDILALKKYLLANPSLTHSPYSKLPLIKNTKETIHNVDEVKSEHEFYLEKLKAALDSFELEADEKTPVLGS